MPKLNKTTILFPLQAWKTHIKFLRAREIVHYQRFGEGLRIATDKMNEKNFYAFNPAFDKNCRS